VPNKAKITTAATVKWSDTQLFDGFLLLGLATPTGHDKLSIDGLRVPLWTRLPIVDGVVDEQSRVWFTNEIEPPGSRYSDFWYAANKQLIASGGTVFSINADPYTITVPSLPVPTAATAPPTPEVPPSVVTQTILTFTLPTIETPIGTINGVNATFTLTKAPQRLIVYKNGVTLKSTVGYTLAGLTITFLAGYIPQTGDELLTTFWE
jgi:hypothetical protein